MQRPLSRIMISMARETPISVPRVLGATASGVPILRRPLLQPGLPLRAGDEQCGPSNKAELQTFDCGISRTVHACSASVEGINLSSRGYRLREASSVATPARVSL